VLLPNLTSLTSQKIQIPFVVIAKIENKFKFLKNEQQNHFWVSYPKNQNASDEYIAIDCQNLTYSQSRHFGTGTIQFNSNAVVEKKKINYNVKKKSMKILNCENLTDFLNERKFQLNTIVKKQKLNYNFKKEPIQVSNFENLTDSLNEGKIELNTILEKQKSKKEPIQVLNFENLMDSQNEAKNGLNTVAEKQNSNHNDVKKKPMRLLIVLTDAKEAYYSVLI
jgi:adenylate cyclase class IV